MRDVNKYLGRQTVDEGEAVMAEYQVPTVKDSREKQAHSCCNLRRVQEFQAIRYHSGIIKGRQ